jgi:ribonuclease P protein component
VGADRTTVASGARRRPGGHEERLDEEDFSTEYPETGQEARISPPDAHARRPGRADEPAQEGSAAARRLIRPVRGRAAFGRFRSEGRRVRRGALAVTFVPGPDEAEVGVAYAIGTGVGSAVVRNRLRRRLRHILAEAPEGLLAPGAYLVQANPPAARLTYKELSTILMGALEALRAER